ncbi:MAG: hypothetical protein AB1749_10375 [Pseudomonadota bacterium]
MAWTRCRRATIAELGRIARDATGGFLAFLLLAVAIGGETSHAAPFAGAARPEAATLASDRIAVFGVRPDFGMTAARHDAGPLDAGRPLARGAGTASAFALLALVFSAVVAFNLAFLRHLVRVYASPRRG